MIYLDVLIVVLFTVNIVLGFMQGNLSAGLGWSMAIMWFMIAKAPNYIG